MNEAGVGGHGAIGPRRRHLGQRRASRPPGDELGLELRGSWQTADSDARRLRRSRQAVPPEEVRDLIADLVRSEKVFVDLACSSHNALWEKNRLLLFRASPSSGSRREP